VLVVVPLMLLPSASMVRGKVRVMLRLRVRSSQHCVRRQLSTRRRTRRVHTNAGCIMVRVRLHQQPRVQHFGPKACTHPSGCGGRNKPWERQHLSENTQRRGNHAVIGWSRCGGTVGSVCVGSCTRGGCG
jgi:hypothetical protein